MTVERIEMYVLEDLRAPALQLHVRPGAGACCALFGWDVSPPLIDEGPPAIAQAVFATALLRCGTLAFLAEPVSHAGQLRRPPRPVLAATDRFDRALALFSSTASWGQQQQAGFVFARGALPTLAPRLITAVLDARDASLSSLDLPEHVIALVLPAVDGDYLELVARSPSVREAMRDAVASECTLRGIPFSARPDLPV